MTDKELMLSGELYIFGGELIDEMKRAKRLTRLINTSTEEEPEKRMRLFRELFGSIGENFWIEPPFRIDYGSNTYIGNEFYANYECIILDVARVTIGDNVFFGPRVSVFTAGHPTDAETRNAKLEFGKEIRIGNDVWIGGNTVINPGVTIGDRVVIGSGSVVTHDIPSDTVAAGVPCKVIREITESEKEYWKNKAAEYRRLRR